MSCPNPNLRVVLLLLLPAAGCVAPMGDEGSSSRMPRCDAGNAACGCADGREGNLACTVDGAAYGACRCDADVPTGGGGFAGGAGAPGGEPNPIIGGDDGGGGAIGGDGDADGSPGAPAAPAAAPEFALPAGTHTLQLEFDGRTRVFDLVVPDTADDGPVPLVVNLHGFTQDRVEFEGITRYGDAGARRGFAVATPDGVDRSWNGGIACCGNASSFTVDDVGFLRALVQEVRDAVWVDPGRVYAAGFSNGAFLTHRLACEAADVFTAIAAAAGGLSPADVMQRCAPGRGVPIVTYFGTADPSFASLAEGTHQAWMQQNACAPEADVSYESGAARCLTYRGCRDGAELTRCLVEGMDHCWPGGPCLFPQSQDVDATAHSFDFLSRFSR